MISEGTDLTIERGIGVITLDFPPVNAMSPALMEGLYLALNAALEDSQIEAIVLLCAGRTFIAGADLKSMGKVKPKIDFFGLQERIESAQKISIAAIHGTALGGGLETAMTFQRRIAVPSARFGLPEVKLGLLPGGGGTQRMPRLVGAGPALDLMITGRMVDVAEAQAIGLIDEIAREGHLREDAISFARRLVDEEAPTRRIRDREDKVAADRRDPGLFDRYQAAHEPLMHGLDAPQAIIRCVAAAVAGPWEQGLAVERAEFQILLAGPQSAALRHLFMAERAAQKLPQITPEVTPLPIRSVGIAGDPAAAERIAAPLRKAGLTVVVLAGGQMPEPFDLLLDLGGPTGTAPPENAAAIGAHTLIGLLTPGAAEAFPDHAKNGLLTGVKLLQDAHGPRLLEIAPLGTSPAALAALLKLARQLGVPAVVMGGAQGFVSDRMIAAAKGDRGTKILTSTDDSQRRQLLGPIVALGRQLTAAGEAIQGSDIDLLWTKGLEFPPQLGGPVWLAERLEA